MIQIPVHGQLVINSAGPIIQGSLSCLFISPHLLEFSFLENRIYIYIYIHISLICIFILIILKHLIRVDIFTTFYHTMHCIISLYKNISAL